MLQKSKKEEMIKELEGAISGSESLVFVNFHGMKVSDETVLRRDLRNQGVGYKVSRKPTKQKEKFQNLRAKLPLLIPKTKQLLLVKFIISRKLIRGCSISSVVFSAESL